ncbi:uncharacterized protein LOC113494332 [Trichoplusia ni]|uniref:Uncharacterized protein LOC113494332 n=1 Tax=Trichoplusia ni TaxID=7111 RepID=A0A7E5VJK1_TRINI|nr:uncharacterized protein LOC113494332 [Trichoplusia ni]
MAFLFVTSFYLLLLLFHSHCHSIERPEGTLSWNYYPVTLIENLGTKTGVSTFSEVCKKLNQARSQKIICLLCKGFDPSCFVPPTSTTSTAYTITIPTTTPVSPSTTPVATTSSTAATPPAEE